MKATDRTRPPVFRNIEGIDIQSPEQTSLDNGIPVYLIDAGLYEIIRLDFIFTAGTGRGSHPLIAQVANAMLMEGTARFSSEEIASRLDSYGAFVQPLVEADSAGLTVYTLTKFLDPVLEVMEEVIKKPAFPGKELDLHLKKRKQQFLVEEEKVKNIARKRFTELVFGPDHPYGKQVKSEDFDTFSEESMKAFARELYHSNNVFLMISGKLSSGILPRVNHFFGGKDWGRPGFHPVAIPATAEGLPVKDWVDKADALQSAIRIGRLVGNRTHPDYTGLVLLNTILGGYFGSRLMKNIREEKGYTYGIGSFILSMHNAGVLAVVTEVGTEVTLPALRETYREMEVLTEIPVPEDELELVKNYLMGELIREFDGPFATAESFRTMIEYGLPPDYFNSFISELKDTGSDRLLGLARKYLQPGSMTEVIAGEKNHPNG